MKVLDNIFYWVGFTTCVSILLGVLLVIFLARFEIRNRLLALLNLCYVEDDRTLDFLTTAGFRLKKIVGKLYHAKYEK